MDWDDLRTFLAIARHGTLSAAARALGVTQPTMGRRLAAMEARNGARLLQRLPGRYALTALGEAVLGNAERIEAEALAAELTTSGNDLTTALGLRAGEETALAGAGDLRRTVGRMHGFKGDSQGDAPKGVKPHASRLGRWPFEGEDGV